MFAILKNVLHVHFIKAENTDLMHVLMRICEEEGNLYKSQARVSFFVTSKMRAAP